MPNAELTTEQKTEIARAFDRGNFANAYESDDLDAFRNDGTDPHPAFTLGFFSSYSLDEIPSDAREAFDEAYFSEVGTYVVKVAGYCDDRGDEYAKEINQ